jgi:hypothetical protein
MVDGLMVECREGSLMSSCLHVFMSLCLYVFMSHLDRSALQLHPIQPPHRLSRRLPIPKRHNRKPPTAPVGVGEQLAVRRVEGDQEGVEVGLGDGPGEVAYVDGDGGFVSCEGPVAAHVHGAPFELGPVQLQCLGGGLGVAVGDEPGGWCVGVCGVWVCVGVCGCVDGLWGCVGV